MLLSKAQLLALLKALGLTEGLFKPIPAIVGGLVDTLDSLPIIGNILEANGPSGATPSSDPMGVNSVLVADSSCAVGPYDPPPVLSQTFPPFDQAKANVFRYRQQQGVNLGSWFVHEQWMTPSVFRCASGPQIAELDIASGWMNTTGSRAVLERHWDTFINQSDFEYLASIGINTVRLPIGYWSLGPSYCQGTPFESVADVYENAWSRVVRAINWAAEVGIGVLVDLHGAPGSQNGQPHSGISDGKANLFGNSTYETKTIEVLTFLAQQLATVTNVVGIQLFNEPNDDDSLEDLYTRILDALRQISTEAAMFPFYIHDGFNLNQYSSFVSKRNDFVVEDHHSYFVFSDPEMSQDAKQDTAEVEGSIADQLANAEESERRNLIVGEWSCALVSDALKDQPDEMLARQQFCEGQQQVYTNTTAGWMFWSYTKEDCDGDLDWCFKSAVNRTLPAIFSSYGLASNSQVAAMNLQRAVFEMSLPSMSEVLQSAVVPSSNSLSTSQSSSAADDCTAVPSSPAETATATASADLSSAKVMSVDMSQHRFSAVHERRLFLSDMKRHRRDANQTALEQSINKGYSDGFMTAKIFAQNGMSKLGFTGQYVSDSVVALGPDVIAPGTESAYSDWFYRGLADAQKAVADAASS